MEIKNNNMQHCDNCEKLDKEISQTNNCEVNAIYLKYDEIYLCDECLQELNRKIVDYLADKNI